MNDLLGTMINKHYLNHIQLAKLSAWISTTRDMENLIYELAKENNAYFDTIESQKEEISNLQNQLSVGGLG